MRLRIPPVLQFFICGTIAVLGSYLLPGLNYDRALLILPASLISIAGILLLTFSVAAFVKARTTVNPLRPEQASQLVTTGLYRISRNPMYLALAMILIGGALMLGNLGALIGPIVFVCLISVLQIKPEERILQTQFGDTYSVYCRQTRRWI